jgi:hypothetical protein
MAEMTPAAALKAGAVTPAVEATVPAAPALTAAPAATAVPASPGPERPEPKGYVVVGAAVVLPTEGGSERYLYRGAPVGSGFTKDGIKHALAVGLIAKAK